MIFAPNRRVDPAGWRFPLVVSLAFFLFGSIFFSRQLSFAPFYHPDEFQKVVQVRDGSRNFHHPQLLLNTAAIIYRLGGSPASEVAAAPLVRWVSVIFATLTIVFLALTAYLLAGPAAQIACGLILFCDPKLFELSHYLKEDAALVMGFSAVFLTFALWERRPTRLRAALLGLAVAVVISAKYIGVFPALLALLGVIMLSRSPRTEKGCWWIFLVTALLAIAIINWQILVQFAGFQQGLGREVSLLQEKSKTLINPKTFGYVRNELGVLGWVALAAWLAVPFYQRRRLRLAEWLILIACFGYGLLLSFSSRGATRYLLPLTISLDLVIVVAGAWLGGAVARRLHQPALIGQSLFCLGLIALFVASDLPDLVRLLRGFSSDNHVALVKFIRQSVPPQAVIAEDEQVKTPRDKFARSFPPWNVSQRVISSFDTPHLGEKYSLDDLRKLGVTHVVLLMDNVTEAALEPARSSNKNQKLRDFLAQLQSQGRLLWQCDGGKPDYLVPPLRLYSIVPAGAQ